MDAARRRTAKRNFALHAASIMTREGENHDGETFKHSTAFNAQSP